MRIDVYMTENGLAESRSRAQAMIDERFPISESDLEKEKKIKKEKKEKEKKVTKVSKKDTKKEQ